MKATFKNGKTLEGTARSIINTKNTIVHLVIYPVISPCDECRSLYVPSECCNICPFGKGSD